MAFRLGITIPVMTDGTSFYRGAGPLASMMLDGRGLNLETGQRIDWVWMRGVDAVFMQRPFSPDHVRIMSMAKLHGKPVWVDYDDDLFTVPSSNPAHGMYRQQSVHHNIMTLITQADVVTCSTEALRTKFVKILEHVQRAGDLNDSVPHKNFSPEKFVVVPNAYDEELLNYGIRHWSEPLPPATRTVMWRGSSTHDADLRLYTPAIAEAFLKAGEGWTMNFVGSPFWQSIETLEARGIESKRLLVTETMDPIEYFHYIFHVQPALMIVPLVDDLFNRSKSNIAWIEASHAGAMTLAPDWPEWKRPGVLNYGSPKEFEEMLTKVLMGIYKREVLVGQSREYIRGELTLGHVNEKRWAVIERLANTDVWA